MFCSACGQRIAEDDAFCSRCGRRVRAASPPPARPVARVEPASPEPPPLEQPWSQKYFLFLLVMTVVAPMVGLIGGTYVMIQNGPKRQQGQILLTLGIAMAVFYLIVMGARREI